MKLPTRSSQARGAEKGGASFLPEEYVSARRGRRMVALHLSLFTVVLLCVAGAFVVTNQQWTDVREHGRAVDIRYRQAAENLEQLNTLEAQAGTLVNKAEVVLALVERVPRSLLIAELTGAMPEQMTLVELELKSTKIRPPATDKDEKKKGKKKGDSTKKSRTSDEGPEAERVHVPRYSTRLVIMGVAPTHQDIARYVSALQLLDLLKGVELKVSESTLLRDRGMIRFRIEGSINPDADPRAETVASADEGAMP